MKVSVIVSTYNGAHKLPGIIHSLQQQMIQDFEVVVVIDGSTDHSSELLRDMNPGFASFKVIEQPNRGRAAVRNLGANMASGELLVFFDDDMLPLEDCIELHKSYHDQFQNAIVTGGVSEPIDAHSSEVLKFKGYLSRKWTNELRADAKGQLTAASIFITAANFSIPKSIFKKLNGFDARLQDAEDFDFAVRAYKAGVSLYYKQEAFAWHNDSFTAASMIKRQRQYALAHAALIKLKPWIQEEGYLAMPGPQGRLSRFFFQLFCTPFWIKAMETGKFSFLSKRLRYRLYDYIITANGVFFPNKVSL